MDGTVLEMLGQSAATIEVVVIYETCDNKSARSSYNITIDESNYKLKDSLDLQTVLDILTEKSSQIKSLTICTSDTVIRLGQFNCLDVLQYLNLSLCHLADPDFQFLIKCKQLKKVELDAIDTRINNDKIDRMNSVIDAVLNVPSVEELILSRLNVVGYLPPCDTIKTLHLKPDWQVHENVLTKIFALMPNLRYLKVCQDTEDTLKYTDQIYKLMESVLSNSDLTFVMYRKTFNNYGHGEIIVVDKDPSKMYCDRFEFESTFFLDFFPNVDVYDIFKAALEREEEWYHIRCLNRKRYTYIK